MKMYRIHDTMREKLNAIWESIQTTLNIHEEFDTLAYDEAQKWQALCDRAEENYYLSTQKEVDGRTIKRLADFIRQNDYLIAELA